MSRCFPYPPPGYALSSARKDALIESIKFQKEKVKADEHKKKEKKSEKKEKKKDKKDKKTQKQDNSDVVHSSLRVKKAPTDAEIKFLHKGSKVESEQLERSSLTEEHAKPSCLRVPSSSSDSTENSIKRKRQPSPADVSRGHGKIIRIRLSSKKQIQSPDTLVNEQKQCSTSGRIHPAPQTEVDIAPRLRNEGFCSTSGSVSNVAQSLVLKTGGERFHLASKPIETAKSALPHQPSKPIETAKSSLTRQPPLESIAAPVVLTAMQKEALLYRNLIENWVPPQMYDGCVDTGDDDWLFGGKNKKVQRSEQQAWMCRDDSTACSSTTSLWPCAQFLPEVDIYALPYTVPF